MAMEMHVLFSGPIPSKAALTRAINELGFPLTIASKGSLDQQSGFMPMRLQREESGVEFDVADGRDSVEDVAGEDVDSSLDRIASFRWGGAEDEMLCAMCASAALAKLTGGLVFEEADGRLMDAGEAARFASEHFESVRQRQGKIRSTRPADFKHYLRRLLNARSDLVLLEKKRMLLIRPVRHILRGALFVPSLDKFSCYVVRFAAPLYSGREVGEPLTGRIHSHLWRVWQPYFVPLLMDVLAEDVFADLGSLTTLSELAELGPCPTAHILSGDKDKAEDLIRTLEPRRYMDFERRLLARDPADLCREFHDREAATAKALGLGDSWQPSPFPVELPAAESHRIAEPMFMPRPWIERPASLFEEAPDRCGPVRFSVERLNREDRVLLVAPLSREQAEMRHRDRASYVLATRLANGLLVVARWGGDGDSNNPERRSAGLGHPDLILELYDASRLIQVRASSFRCGPGLMTMDSLSVRPDRGSSNWHCSVSADDNEALVHDFRGPEKIVTTRALTAEDTEIVTLPIPDFGAFEDLVERVNAWLSRTGYGAIV